MNLIPKRTRLWKPIPLTDHLIGPPLGMVHDHWFRRPHDQPTVDRCPFKGFGGTDECGRPGAAHLRWNGEWMNDRGDRWSAMFGRIKNHLKA